MNTHRLIFAGRLLAAVATAASINATAAGGGAAPPGAGGNQYGAPSVWASSMKQGIGTSYEKYDPALSVFGHADTGTVSRVWFSLAEGIVTETAYGLIHEAQLKDMGFLITGTSGGGWFDEERLHTNHSVSYLHTDAAGRPLSPAYRIVNTDVENRYRITKDVFTDPGRQSLFMRVSFQAFENGITPYLLVNPHVANTGNQDVGFTGGDFLGARNVADNRYLVVRSSSGFVKTSAGYVGVNDGWSDLHADRAMDFEFDFTEGHPPQGRGNVALTGQLAGVNTATVTFDIVIGFGDSLNEADANAQGSLGDGYQVLLDRFNGVGAVTGWEDYLAGLSQLGSLIPATGDNGRLLHSSALMLKSMEDKTHAGALIACLCVPWGESVSADDFATGYRAVWVRDFFQVGMALLAMGDADTAKVAFKYLPKVQVRSTTPGVGAGNKMVTLLDAHAPGIPVKPEVAVRQMDVERVPPPVVSPVPLPGGGGTDPIPPVVPPTVEPPAASLKPKRFHGTAELDPTRVGRDASRIAEEVIAHLAGLVGSKVTVTIEVEAQVPDGASDQVVRTVTENCRTLKFTSHGFERA